MELDQRLFQKVWGLFSGHQKIQELDLQRFQAFASLVTGLPCQVRHSGDNGGFRGVEIHLPTLQFLSSKSKRLKKELKEHGLQRIQESFCQFYNLRILDAAFAAGYPGGYDPEETLNRNRGHLESQCRRFLASFGLQEYRFGKETPAHRQAEVSGPVDLKAREGQESEMSIHMSSQTQEVKQNQKEIDDYTLSHNFEKIETLEEFQGNWRELDGNDEIEEQASALEELAFNQIIRTEEESAGYLTADHAGFASEISGEVRGPFLYPEWDYRKSRFRPDHCSVSEESPAHSGIGAEDILRENSVTLMRLRHDLDRILNRFGPVPRQSQGEEIDVDAAVDYLVDRSIGRTPSENLYRKKRRNIREVDLMLLVDNSLSTDSFRNGIRVMDAEKKALLLFGQTLHESGLEFACYSFSSRTRHNCLVRRLHDFGKPWLRSREAILGLEPSGYTRIGPALRHATAAMEKRASRHRWILLFTDGHPNDYDRYEGRYGQEDVRHAILEAESAGVGVHILCFDRSRDIFGGYAESALNLRQLPDHLLAFYGRIMGQ